MVKIISDSTCDLSEELRKRYQVDIIPLCIRMDEKEYKDGIDITPEDIYRWSGETNLTPKTAAPSVEDVERILKPYVDNGDDIIVFTISSEMSTTMNVISMVAEDMGYAEHIYVVDSMNLSTGVGLLVVEAAQMALDGKSAKEIVSVMEALRPNVRASFVVDTLKFLHRGGRCSATSALVGGVFKIKPRIYVEDGKMDAGKKYRGSIDKVIMQYVKDMQPALLNARQERVFITHSGCNEETVHGVEEYLKGLQHFKEIFITRAGGVISSHCGPGTLGVLFIEKEKNFGPYDSEFDVNHNGIMEADEKNAEAMFIRHLAEKEEMQEEEPDGDFEEF